MWYYFKKHVCDKCNKEFEYSEDTLTLAQGINCPYCKTQYNFIGLNIQIQETNKST